MTRPTKRRPATDGIAKAPSRRVRVLKRTRPGDIRPTLELDRSRPALLAQVARALLPFIQFRRGLVMHDESGAPIQAHALQRSLYHSVRPDRTVSQQGVVEACRLIAKEGLVPEACLLSTRPQLARDGTVRSQPGAVGTRVYTTYTAGAAHPTLRESMAAATADPDVSAASTGDEESTRDRVLPLVRGTPTLEDLAPNDLATPADRAGLLVALIAPSLAEFEGAVNIFIHPTTAAWVLPASGVPYVDAALPTPAKLAALDREMIPAAAVDGRDPGAAHLTKMIMRDHHTPVYMVGKRARDSVPTICVRDIPAPRDAVLHGITAFVVTALRTTGTPIGEDGAPATLFDALDAILKAADLPQLAEILILPEAPVVAATVAQAEAKAEVAANHIQR